MHLEPYGKVAGSILLLRRRRQIGSANRDGRFVTVLGTATTL